MAPRRKFDFNFKERVLQYAEEHSAEKAARHFSIDSKRIRYWRKQKAELLSADGSRARLAGGGRKKVNLELERKLSAWIYSVWDGRSSVSAKMITGKALEIASVSSGGEKFVASRCWLLRFLQRNNLSLRGRTSADREDPDLLAERLVSFVDRVGETVASKGILEKDVIAMDEIAVWFHVVSPPPADARSAKKTARHEKSRLTVVLAAAADGTKLQPYVVFKGAAVEAKAMQRQVSSAVIAASDSGWMNDALTADWLQSVAGKFSATPRLLVWDSYHRHISAATKAELKRGYDITAAAIPGGCAKYIQAADVTWKRPFEQSLRAASDRWAAADARQEYAAGGALKAPSRRLLVDWVVAAWDRLDEDLIRESFKVCGLSVKADGSEDDLILCLGEGQACAAGREALRGVRQRSRDSCRRAAWDEEDDEELFNNELVVFDDDEEDNDDGEDEDFGEEDSDHVSWHCFIHQALPSNSKKRIIIEEERQEWSPRLDQEEPPEPPRIKEEEEELWSGQEEERLRGSEEADVAEFTLAAVKSEEDDEEEKPQSSQLHRRQTEQMETDADGDDCGGPGPAGNSDPERHLTPAAEDSSEPETDDSDDWTESREPQSGLKAENKSVWGERLCQ